ncbi:hypothetical protein Btru_003753 [Bulinus truncatus]|nr:hypothetical protein Btru_003753 [Bulinus truncatus]
MKLLLLCCLLLTQTNSALCQSLTATPSQIINNSTNSFLVNCTFQTGIDPSLTSLTSLTISRSVDASNLQYQVLASVDSFNVITNSASGENLTSSGTIDNTGLSYLSLTWDNPFRIKSGVYKCDANGLHTSGQPLTLSTTINVTGVNSEIDSLKEELIQLKNYVDSLEAKIEKLNVTGSDFMTIWVQRLNNVQETLFETSEVYNGSQYYLYKDSPSHIPGVAQATCEIYGGNLAEIQDSDEYDYIINFIEQFTWVRFLLVGGSQYGEAGNWVYPHSNASVEYFRWAEAYPFYKMAYDCLVLWDVYNWNMTNLLCSTDQTQWPIYYLCEVKV